DSGSCDTDLLSTIQCIVVQSAAGVTLLLATLVDKISRYPFGCFLKGGELSRRTPPRPAPAPQPAPRRQQQGPGARARARARAGASLRTSLVGSMAGVAEE